ncbi:hypothetical protein NUW58_g7264 [Xylaria curta]|uniref:Uncharacterized protein n=1 Tax=Xylaria curta TaxID=42375 RepID=A0ACC1NIT6_9PEZI|nr:hypothetical protein NUW58_g7264 [Xylaria curta]
MVTSTRFKLLPALAKKHGFDDVEEYMRVALKRFSLLETGILEMPSTRLLLVNGTLDGLMPIEDSMLLFDLTRQVHDAALEIIRGTPSTSRYPSANTRKPLLIIQQGGVHLRSDVSRRNSINIAPYPQEILSPNISLHLFPSTHPYLPTVSGRVAYIAALWTSPIAWNRVPIIGNVRLEILSERMVSQPLHFSPRRPGAYGEQLVVKWRTASSSSGEDTQLSLAERGEQNFNAHLRGSQAVGEKKAFTGLFVFEFDKDGRVISHTIEHVDEHGEWEKGVGARVVGLTDWLLGGIKGRSENAAAVSLRCAKSAGMRTLGKDYGNDSDHVTSMRRFNGLGRVALCIFVS